MSLDRCLNVDDLRRKARATLPRPVFDFLDGGSEDERSMQRNRDAYLGYGLVPRSMNDVSRVDPSVTALGQALAWPLIIGPTGLPGLLHPDGEIGVARAAARTGALYTLSTMSSRSIEEVAAATDALKAFQLYIFRDRGITRELIQRARTAGYAALILTVDLQVPAKRERDLRSGMTIPPRLGPASLVRFARHPVWCWRALRNPVCLANFEGHRAAPGTTLLDYINEQFEPAASWADLQWVAHEWGGPIAVKGVLHPGDAARVIAEGADAVILSNHGGRQLDTAVAALDILDETLQRVGGAGEVIIDGGIRRGTDMLKAMALGASACMAGRPALYGLAAGGETGTIRALTLLRGEYERGMALLGIRDRAGIDRSCIRRISPCWVR